MHAEKLPAARGMSYEEFLDWCDVDTLAEWVDGCAPRERPPASDPTGSGSARRSHAPALAFTGEERSHGAGRCRPRRAPSRSTPRRR